MSVKPNSYFYVVSPFCGLILFYGSYIIYLLCFSFKGSSDNAEALVTSVQYKRGSFLKKTKKKKNTRLSHPFGSFLLLFTLGCFVFVGFFSSFLSFFLSVLFKRQEFKNLANFPAWYDQSAFGASYSLPYGLGNETDRVT